MGQAAPDQLAVPRAAIRAAGKAQAELVEASDDAVRRALLLEQIEDRADGPLTSWSGSSTILSPSKTKPTGSGKRSSPLAPY